MEFLNLGAGSGYAVRGNPALRPERSTGLSAGAEWSAGAAYLRASAFHNRFRDFIETRLEGDSAGLAVYTYGNVQDGRTRGVEAGAGVARGALRAEAGYAYLEAHDAGTGQRLLGRPRHSAHASLEYAFAAGPRASLVGAFTGATPLAREDDTTVERGRFVRLDAAVAQPLPGGVALRLGVRNLLDARPAEWAGYTGRHLYLGVEWNVAEGFRP